MAGSQKKRALRQKAESEHESESESYNGQDEILADFEGRNPEGQDFHGIKQLLNQLFLKAHIDLSQLSDMLINQTGLGSVLKQSSNDDEMDDDEDDDMTDAGDVFGITSVINLTQNRETPCIQQFFALLKELSTNHAEKAANDELLKLLSANKKLGLLINERFINIPAKIADPLLTSLESELERMKKKNNNYNFDYYVMICKTYKSKPKPNKETEVVFSNAEEELFARESKISFDFDVLSESDTGLCGKWTEGDVEMIPYRKVIIFEGAKFPSIVQQVKIFVA